MSGSASSYYVQLSKKYRPVASYVERSILFFNIDSYHLVTVIDPFYKKVECNGNTLLIYCPVTGPQRNTAAPAYNGNATTSTHYQNMNVMLNDTNCPYYQLYGPPPSYETVIAQTRGKISNPASPEASAARMSLQTGNVIPNPSVPQCFFYTCNSTPRLVNGNPNQSENMNQRQLDSHESVPFAHFSQYCAASSAVTQSMCVPLEYPDASTASGGSNFGHGYQNSPNRLSGYPTDRLSDASDTENTTNDHAAQNAEKYNTRTLDIDAATSSYKEHLPWNGVNDQSVLNVHDNIVMRDENQVSQSPKCTTTAETHTISPKSKASDSDKNEESMCITSPVIAAASRERNFSRERTNYGGSLRLPRRHAGSAICQDSFHVVASKDLSSFGQGVFNSTGVAASECATRKTNSSEREPDVDAPSSSQSNPSNNVILETFIFENASLRENIERARGPRAMNRSTNFDLESKHKLDRSKSLD